MRRSMKILLAAASLAAICAVGAGASAAAGPILCPGGGQFCCGPPTTAAGVCCEPTVIGCPSISISVVPDPSKAGHNVRITGREVIPAAGATVTLWQELAGQSAFQSAGQTTTDATGSYAFTRRAMTNRSWYVSTTTGRSAVVFQDVEAAITLHAATAGHGSGIRVVFTGKVTPSHAGERIKLERRSGRSWIVIATTVLSRSSSFRVVDHVAAAFRADMRAVLGGDRRNIKSYSPVVKTVI